MSSEEDAMIRICCDGATRTNIGQDIPLSEVSVEGNNTTLRWIDVCKVLASKQTDKSMQVNIVDSVIFEEASVVAYIFTGPDGNVRRKPRAYHSLAHVRDEFLKIASVLQQDGCQYVAVACKQDSSTPVILNMEGLNSICTGAAPPEPFVLQSFVPSKGNTSSCTTYRSTLSLKNHGKALIRVERLGISEEITRPFTHSNKMGFLSMNRSLNKEMEKACMALVSRLENTFPGRMTKLVVDFVQDIHGKIWIQNTQECRLAMVASPERPMGSADKFKNTRVGKAADFGDSGGNVDSLTEGFVFSRPSSIRIGRHSDVRVDDKRSKERPPADELVNQIVQETNERSLAKGSFLQKLSPLKSRRVHGEILEAVNSDPMSAHASHRFHTMQVPNARLGVEVPIAESTSMFGSTQLDGCHGDFCNFDISFLDCSYLDFSSAAIHRKLRHRQRLTTIVDGLEASSTIAKMMKSKSSASLSALDVKMKQGGSQRVNVADNRQRGDGMRPSVPSNRADADADAALAFQQCKIPYRSIIQARQEMPLVKLQLFRHRVHEDGDYVSEETYADLAVAGKLPAHYYQDVSCCMNCFKIYTVINEARGKALKKIAKGSRGATRGKWETSRSRSKHSVHGLSSIPSMASQFDYLPDGITKLDIAEIRTMVKPPPAVEVVLEAVTCLLTGKMMTFQDTKQLLSGGEAFLTMLREFRLDDVTDSRLRLVEPYVDNPLFRPENVQSAIRARNRPSSEVHDVSSAGAMLSLSIDSFPESVIHQQQPQSPSAPFWVRPSAAASREEEEEGGGGGGGKEEEAVAGVFNAFSTLSDMPTSARQPHAALAGLFGDSGFVVHSGPFKKYLHVV